MTERRRGLATIPPLTPTPGGPARWSEVYPSGDPTGEVHLNESIIIDRDITVEGIMVHRHDGMPAPVLEFDPTVSVLVESSGSIAIGDGATLRMRPDDETVVHEIRFTGIAESMFIGGGGEDGAPMDHADFPNDVGLWVHGSLDLVGHERCPWTRTTAGLSAAATSCVVEDATGWQVGDELAFCPTGDPATDSLHETRYDHRTITSITPGAGTTATIGFAALTYAHPAVTFDGTLSGSPHTFTYCPEVLNLTRNVIIGGTATGRSHVMVHARDVTDPLTVENVLLRWMGPQKTLPGSTRVNPQFGRYPFHFHFADTSRAGTVMRNVVAVDSGARGFVTHATHQVTWERCVAHRVQLCPYWWDMNNLDFSAGLGPGSDDVFYDRCVASLVTPPPGGFDRSAEHTGMVLNQGSRTKAHGCVVVAVQGGNEPSSGYNWPEATNNATQDIVWDFEGNTAHNCTGQGVYVWQNDAHPHTLIDCQFWRNDHYGITHGAYINSYLYEDVTLWGNKQGPMNMVANSSMGGPIIMRRVTFDADGTTNALLVPHHFATPVSANQLIGCEFRGYTGQAVLVASTPAQFKDSVKLTDPVFDGAEATWFWFEDDMHQDGKVEVEFTGGDHFELHRYDWLTGTFVADWNAKRVDL